MIKGNVYLNNLLCELCKFDEKLDELSNKVYPSSNFKILINNDLKEIVNEFKNIICQEINNADQKNNYQTGKKALNVIEIWKKNHLQNIAKAVASSDFKSQPLEIMNVFRDLLKDIDNNEFEIFTVPTEKFNFSFLELWIRLKNVILNNFDIKNIETDKKLIRLTFPEEQKENLLLSGIFFHEVGHYLDRENKLAEKIFTSLDFNGTNFNKLRNKIINRSNGNKIDYISLIKFLKLYYLMPWLRELISDSIAVYMLGPAYIFSIMEFIFSTGGQDLLLKGNLSEQASHTHPRFSIRYKLIFKIIKELGFKKMLPDTLWQKLFEYKETLDAADFVNESNRINIYNYYFDESEDYFKILECILQQTYPVIMEEINNLLGNKIIDNKSLNIAQKLAEDRIKNVIPPNEVKGEPADAVAILNSGWFAKILFKDEIKKKVGNINETNGDFDLNNLINSFLKFSLKTARIHKRWNQ